jgi:hypothetical protein
MEFKSEEGNGASAQLRHGSQQTSDQQKISCKIMEVWLDIFILKRITFQYSNQKLTRKINAGEIIMTMTLRRHEKRLEK